MLYIWIYWTNAQKLAYAGKVEIILDCLHYENELKRKLNEMFSIIAETRKGTFHTEMSQNIY